MELHKAERNSHKVLVTYATSCADTYKFQLAHEIANVILSKYGRSPVYTGLVGYIYYKEREIDSAIDYFIKAQQAGLPFYEYENERWMCWMLKGEFEKVWLESDAIFERGRLINKPDMLWKRVSPYGKKVLIRCKHGLGDTIQFMRYFLFVEKIALELRIEIQEELVPLLKCMGLEKDIFTSEYEPELEIEVMELPYVFRAKIDTIPVFPYIPVFSSSERTMKYENKFKVGLVYGAGLWKADRSIPIEKLAPLFDLSEMTFFSLQRGPLDNSIKLKKYGIIHTGSDVDIMNTIEFLNELDVLVTVDTMMAHLAGAIGMKVLLLLNFDSDWRWMLKRNDSPWYRDMELFRQIERWNWDYPVSLIRKRLLELASEKKQNAFDHLNIDFNSLFTKK